MRKATKNTHENEIAIIMLMLWNDVHEMKAKFCRCKSRANGKRSFSSILLSYQFSCDSKWSKIEHTVSNDQNQLNDEYEPNEFALDYYIDMIAK